jgi:hypothetical protein
MVWAPWMGERGRAVRQCGAEAQPLYTTRGLGWRVAGEAVDGDPLPAARSPGGVGEREGPSNPGLGLLVAARTFVHARHLLYPPSSARCSRQATGARGASGDGAREFSRRR